MKRISCIAFCLLVGIFLVSCGSNGDSETCASVCPRVVAADCDEGPPTDADCIEYCTLMQNACPTEMKALLTCISGKNATCDADGDPVFQGCGTEDDALMACFGE